MSNQGTPGTLLEAIENGIGEGPIQNNEDQAMNIMRHVSDFLAQGFNAAMLEPVVSTEEEKRLLELFKKITGRK